MVLLENEIYLYLKWLSLTWIYKSVRKSVMFSDNMPLNSGYKVPKKIKTVRDLQLPNSNSLGKRIRI